MRQTIAIIILLFFSCASFAQSEHINFSRIDISNGLSHNQVTCILRDEAGFLWFGTVSGLNRFDGYTTRVFRQKSTDSNSIADNYVNALFELPEGKMWVKSNNGPACVYDAATEKFARNTSVYLESLNLPAGSVNSIEKGTDGSFWFLYDSIGLYKVSSQQQNAKPQKLAEENKDGINRMAAFKVAPGGTAWLLYQNGLLQQIDTKTQKIIFSSNALSKVLSGNFLYNFFIDKQGDLWLWAGNAPLGLFLYNKQSNSFRSFNETSFPQHLNNNLVTGVIQDSHGRIWAATDHGGINVIDKERNYNINYLTNDLRDPKSLSQNSTISIYKDNKGIVWIGTYKKGINYWNENIAQFAHYHYQESNLLSLPFDDVNRFVEDKEGNIWIGTNGGGLIYFDRKKNSFRQYLHNPANSNSLSNNVIVSLCVDHNGLLWIGTYFGGLNSFDGKNFTHYKHDDANENSLSDDRIWEIFEDAANNLWIGTLNGGLNLLERETGRFKHFTAVEGRTDALTSNYISAIEQDQEGKLWIGTNAGITVYAANGNKPVQYKHTGEKNTLSNNNVISILEDSKGRIWVGTREGLNLFDKATNSFRLFTTEDGLPDNSILTILEDNRHTLWLTTPNGLCNILLNDSSGKQLSFSVINYDEVNNLQGKEFNENAALKTRSGELIFGGPAGFNIINPGNIKKAVEAPVIVFTNLQIFNKTVEVGEEINNRVLLPKSLSQLDALSLKYKENVFSIEFTSLDFTHGRNEKYAYKLEGFNPDWLYTEGQQRRITYTNLDPGTYTFKVKVLNDNGQWSKEQLLKLSILPPFWRTPLAYVLYALAIVGMLFIARRITLDRAHMRFEVNAQRKEAERIQTLDKLKTKFFTNVSHEFRTPLSLIISPLDKIISNTADPDQKKQLNLVYRNARRLLNLVNQLLDFRKMEVQEIKLHPSIGDIISFIRDISYSFVDIADKKGISFSFDTSIEELEVYFDKDKMEKILFNLLSNAFKYTPDNGSVGVSLSYAEPTLPEIPGTLTIKVNDSGIGIPDDQVDRIFERYFQSETPANMMNQGTGIGLAITREFVKLHHGTITVTSNSNEGTCFNVAIPARKIYIPSETQTGQISIENEEELDDLDLAKHKPRHKTILLVEDNEDIRFYLKENLREEYKVVEAVNGKEGWEKVNKLSPDLVVSDIMMPEMDGIELARRIKTGTPTAHIPVILLTAMGSEEKQLEGFQAGVNDYITKPFTYEILASRIRNLLAQQKLLQRKFQKQIEVNPSEITITTVDEQFIRQALENVEKNIDNPDFSVEDLSREMHMSRVALYRKILSLTGKAPLEFIRSIRLKRAARLLEKSGLSIAEIAYDVGFNNPKNFSKYFKEEFGMIPSQYLAAHKEKIG